MSTPFQSCGATHHSVIGRCGRDAGHDGPHRSTGATFEASWTAKHDRPERPQLEPLPDPVIPST